MFSSVILFLPSFSSGWPGDFLLDTPQYGGPCGPFFSSKLEKFFFTFLALKCTLPKYFLLKMHRSCVFNFSQSYWRKYILKNDLKFMKYTLTDYLVKFITPNIFNRFYIWTKKEKYSDRFRKFQILGDWAFSWLNKTCFRRKHQFFRNCMCLWSWSQNLHIYFAENNFSHFFTPTRKKSWFSVAIIIH